MSSEIHNESLNPYLSILLSDCCSKELYIESVFHMREICGLIGHAKERSLMGQGG
jgi:hypothetical protein